MYDCDIPSICEAMTISLNFEIFYVLMTLFIKDNYTKCAWLPCWYWQKGDERGGNQWLQSLTKIGPLRVCNTDVCSQGGDRHAGAHMHLSNSIIKKELDIHIIAVELWRKDAW